MSIRITKASDPIRVENLVSVYYAPPGLGKTSLGFTAEAPLLLDFDGGVHRSQFRKDSVRINNWADVESMTESDLASYKTIIVDTAGRALDVLTADLIRKNPKLKGYGGALSLQGYGALKPAFVGWLRMLQGYNKDVVLLAHMDEQKNGDEMIERLDVQGGSKGEIYKCADAMGRLQLINGNRVLNFSPSDTAFGKNPAQLPPLSVPDYKAEPLFLAGVLQSIKDKLNESSAATLAEQARLEELKASFEFLETPDQFTAKVAEMKKASPKDKALLVSVADTKGFTFDKAAKQFVAKETEATAAA